MRHLAINRTKPGNIAVLLVLLSLISPHLLIAQPIVQHDLRIVLQPDQHHMQATDIISFPKEMGKTLAFHLHADLQPTTSTPGVQLTPQPTTPQRFSSAIPTHSYTVTLPPHGHTLELHYEGNIVSSIQSGPDDTHHDRGMVAAISRNGIFLSAPTYWYPLFENVRLTFTLDVQLPPAWDAVSQGQRTRHEHKPDGTHVRWVSPEPQEQIYLVGGIYTEYQRTVGDLQAMAFLRTPNATLADRYLDATAPYIAMYQSLIGPYPYAKFALVENFWESGYGMPSFTLMGSKVIRLPFILYTSYPHEILHNWWGNGVYIDATEGNWAEGLTAYLADHLMQEQRGTDAIYRRTALQKYTDYVAAQKDFPLTAFRARHNAVTQAVGYGKAMMLFHMLRQQMGDAAFTQALRTFYREYLFRAATFGDLLRSFGTAAGIDPQAIFAQWVARTGAPQLRIGATRVELHDAGYVLSAVIQQEQPGPAYRLRIPIAVTLEGQDEAFQTTVVMPDKHLDLRLRLPSRPLRLDIDPQFDIFRRLHRQEMPPALSQLFGADRLLLVLPAAAPQAGRRAYEKLAQTWQKTSSQQIEIRWDDTMTALPTDRAVWLFGWENRWRSLLAAALAGYDLTLHRDRVRLHKTELRRDKYAVVLTARHPSNAQLPIAWLGADQPAALPGLARKLPHYGKYSYLSFSGDAPTIHLKGQWPVMQSPMTRHLSQRVQIPMGKLQARPPLISISRPLHPVTPR
jgi:aminopeptidase N